VKDNLVCRIVNEPLVAYDTEGKPVLVLAESVPSRENNLLAADGKSVTWKLKSGVKWSDGTAFTADDVVFTWEYVTDKATASTQLGIYEGVSKVEKVDDLNVKFSFTEPNPVWFRAAQSLILPKHIFQNDKGANARNSPNNLKPVGTGPYKVTDFKPGDTVTMVINETYREPNKPFFDRLDIKGGGDSASSARAVLQTGDYDYAWNLQVTDTVLKQLEQNGKGVAEFIPALGCERIALNFADPNKEDPETGERASVKFPHPFLSDLKVRQALALACDRNAIVQTLYGRGGDVGVNLLDEPPQFRSKNNTAEFSVEKAGALLDEAGWAKGSGGFRAKGGVQLSLLFQSSVNDVRQKTQQVVKDGWERAGAKTELKSIDSAVFFSSDAGNPDTLSKFYADAELYASTYSIDPQSYMRNYHSKYINAKANSWSLSNASRYANPEYDKLFDQALVELDAAKRNQLFIQMNDIVVKDIVHIPLVARKSVIGRSKTLKGVNVSPYDTDYWNIADWTR
jgi:peptide/nickel transport system substrate-binding protein